MRRLLLPLVLLLLPMPVASAATGPATLRVSGTAGSVARVALPSGAVLGNAGLDTAISAPGATWAGVVVRRADRSPHPDSYYRIELYERLLCPGRHCAPPAYFQPTAGTPDDGNGRVRLRAGTYAVTLLGEPGTRVTVTIATHTGRGSRAVTARERARFAAKSFVPVADAAVHDFVALDVPRDGRGFQIGVLAVVAYPAGSYDGELCLTVGGSQRFDATPGGTAPCHDFSGEDFFAPQGGPVTNVDGTYVAMPWWTSDGPVSTEDRLGVGLDGAVTGTYGRIAGVGVSLAD